jgi:hypothetical protein
MVKVIQSREAQENRGLAQETLMISLISQPAVEEGL